MTRVTRGLAEWRRVTCQLSRGPACQLPDNGIPADNAGTQSVKTDLSSTLAHNGDHFCHYLKNRMIYLKLTRITNAFISIVSD